MGLFDKAISEEKQIVGRKNMSLNRKRKLITEIGDEKEVMQKVLKKVEKAEGGVLTKTAIEKGANRTMANEQRQKRKAGNKTMNKKGKK